MEHKIKRQARTIEEAKMIVVAMETLELRVELVIHGHGWLSSKGEYLYGDGFVRTLGNKWITIMTDRYPVDGVWIEETEKYKIDGEDARIEIKGYER